MVKLQQKNACPHLLYCFFQTCVISGFIDDEIKSRILTVGKSEFQCTDCGHSTTKKTNLLRHIESKHMILEAIACKFCEKMCPSKNALSSHVSRYHRFQQ